MSALVAKTISIIVTAQFNRQEHYFSTNPTTTLNNL